MSKPDRSIEVIPYDPMFPAVYAHIAAVLAPMLPENAHIEHVGSTAIPGVGGKGIIDCLIIVNADQAAQVAVTLWEAGYGEDVQLRHMRADWWYAAGDFDHEGNVYPVHIHISWAASKFANDIVDFRDHLRAHPDVALDYECLKLFWQEEAEGIRSKFTALKSPYVEAILAKARGEE